MSRRTPPRRPAAALATVVFALVLTGPIMAAEARRVDVQGTLRDDRGRPVPDAGVDARSGVDVPGHGTTYETRSDTTDDAGRYRIDGVLVPQASPTADAGSALVGYGSATRGGAEYPGFGPALRRTPAGGVLRADLVGRNRDVTLHGRLAVRGGASPAGGTVTVFSHDPSAPGNWSTDADDQGRWTLAVPSGRMQVRAQSTYGLQTIWPDLPDVRDDRIETLTYGETRTMDFSMRPRMALDATSEFGETIPGYVGRGETTSPTARYPRDPRRSVTVSRGALARVGTPTQDVAAASNPPGTISTFPGFPLQVRVRITNAGDDVLWVDGGHFEGLDAGTFQCDDGRIAQVPPELAATTRVPAPCDDVWVRPGESIVLALHGLPSRDVDAYDVTFVAHASSPAATLRIPLRIRRLRAPTSPAAASPTATTTTRSTSRGEHVRVTLRRTRLSAVFPRAGAASFRLTRRSRTAHGTRWRAVRTVRLRAARAGTRTARLRRFAPGVYRVRTRARLGGVVATRTTTQRVARR